jgi:hypothetical protein
MNDYREIRMSDNIYIERILFCTYYSVSPFSFIILLALTQMLLVRSWLREIHPLLLHQSIHFLLLFLEDLDLEKRKKL